ncbi:hypothetical protein [Mycobacterium sp. IDR2000157661]|uniref:hypothetical protein n=1 Tax=Mycobacterium sp. IDR2000157661 TaxID=2867005 RepID=UPI001EEA028A|nr:hypothetical protein [Mycobacterium sp. IDR2000157661]ULE32400.1 hypothetical protein K3G64_20090 [Mycobacterium sp. IDR2000157661]
MRVITLISAVALAVAACSGERIVTTDEPYEPTPTSTTKPPPAPPRNSAHLVDAFDYVAHPGGTAVYYFTTPSGRWACAIVPRTRAGCMSATAWQSGMGVTGQPDEVLDAQGEPTTPNAVVVDRTGEPTFVALEQPEFVFDNATVLPFNRILNAAGFRCNVQESGVSCMSEASGKGFSFAPEGFVPQYTEVPPGAP